MIMGSGSSCRAAASLARRHSSLSGMRAPSGAKKCCTPHSARHSGQLHGCFEAYSCRPHSSGAGQRGRAARVAHTVEAVAAVERQRALLRAKPVLTHGAQVLVRRAGGDGHGLRRFVVAPQCASNVVRAPLLQRCSPKNTERTARTHKKGWISGIGGWQRRCQAPPTTVEYYGRAG